MQQWRKRARRLFHPPLTFSKTSTSPTEYRAANMAKMTIREALSSTIRAEMERDPNLLILGEDIVGGNGTAGGPEAIGGIWGMTGGLYSSFGPKRVIDTPISESCIVGAAAGAALAGKRAIAELMFADFVGVCLDQIYNQIAKFRYMFGGRTTCP